ncbi:MAG: hypothetical protein ACRDHO_01355 [Actinomycetota bacterium]
MASYLVIHIRTEEVDTFVDKGGDRVGRNHYTVPTESVRFETWGVRIDLTSAGAVTGYKPRARSVMLPWPRIIRIDEMEGKTPSRAEESS